ncbi:MAG: HAD family phosphatase [Candidatus Obscuribacterales bacterium]|nr:HAD family phosphatase [Candidatus Obscuribacterales bacterium]
MIKALIFDMDGVIVDSEPLHLKAYQEFFSAYGIGYKQEENQQFLGCKDIAIADILIKRYNLPLGPKELVQNKEQILCRLLRTDAQPRPGLKRILQEATNLKVPMAVASSATMPAIELVMEVLQVRNYFHHLSSGDEVPNGKPAPDVFLLAAKRLGVQPADCLVIEDTLNGIKAAKAAGMHCLSIPCAETKHQDHSLADMHLSSLEELDLKGLLA